jgi:hypothetical protein
VLDTGAKYTLAFFGTIFAGIGMERLIQQRRRVMAGMGPGRKRLLVSAAFYGTQLTVGYMLMLVIMIYAGVLFLATVLGLVSGHVLFNAQDAIWPLKDTNETKYVAPDKDKSEDDGIIIDEAQVDDTNGACCCAGANIDDDDDDDDDPETARAPSSGRAAVVPEGITPCCQFDSAGGH